MFCRRITKHMLMILVGGVALATLSPAMAQFQEDWRVEVFDETTNWDLGNYVGLALDPNDPDVGFGIAYSGPNCPLKFTHGSYRDYAGVCDVPPNDPMNKFVAIAAGGDHALGLKEDGTIIAWGANHVGQCDVPQNNPNNQFVAIAAGGRHSLALKQDGTIVAWGSNWFGQCNVPQNDSGNQFIAIAAGWDTSVALKEDGTIVAWGYNKTGETDVPPNDPADKFVAISTGSWHSMALREHGSVIRFPDAPGGPPPEDNKDFVAVAANGGGCQALKRLDLPEIGGSIVAWKLGLPVYPPGDNKDFVAIAASRSFYVAAKSQAAGGALVTWGNNNFGQCNPPPPPTGEHFIAVSAGDGASAGGDYALALTNAGTILAWGLNNDGTPWETEVVASSGSYTSLAYAPSGAPSIVFASDSPLSLKLTSKNGTSWSIESIPLDSGEQIGSMQQASLVYDGTGQPAVCYARAKKSPGGLVVARKKNGAWTKQLVESGGSAGAWNSMALDGSGNPAVAYTYVSGSTTKVKFASWNATKKVWTIETLGNGSTPALAYKSGLPSVVARDLGKVVFWFKKSNGTWVRRDDIDTTTTNVLECTLNYASDGTAYVAYSTGTSDPTPSTVKIANCIDPSNAAEPWTIEVVGGGNNWVGTLRTVIDAYDAPAVHYYYRMNFTGTPSSLATFLKLARPTTP